MQPQPFSGILAGDILGAPDQLMPVSEKARLRLAAKKMFSDKPKPNITPEQPSTQVYQDETYSRNK